MKLDQPGRAGQHTVVHFFQTFTLPMHKTISELEPHVFFSVCLCLMCDTLFPPDAQTVKRIGRLVMRRVCVPELDQRFSDMAETFNEQHERYEAMVRNIRNLRQSYSCNHNDTLALTECVGMIRDEHGK